jgi:hypothetical protein
MTAQDVWFLQMLMVAPALGLIPAFVARKKGRSGFGWWLFGFALAIIAIPAILSLRIWSEPPEFGQIWGRV